MEIVVALLVVGALLLFLETILPGLIAGIGGFCCLVAGVWISYSRFGAQTGHIVLLCVLAGLAVAMVVWIKYFPESRFARPFISHGVIGGTQEMGNLLNKTGTAHTNLRPSGTAVIEGQRVDVVTEGGMISKGASLKVVQVEGTRIVVRAV